MIALHVPVGDDDDKNAFRHLQPSLGFDRAWPASDEFPVRSKTDTAATSPSTAEIAGFLTMPRR